MNLEDYVVLVAVVVWAGSVWAMINGIAESARRVARDVAMLRMRFCVDEEREPL